MPKVVMDWFNKVVEENRREAVDQKAKTKIEWKVRHTRRVVEWGKKIMEIEGGEWNWRQGLVVCQLHDIGRFPQSLMGSFDDKKSLNHAKIGRKMFEEAKINLSEFDGKTGEIAEAIGEHNNPEYLGSNRYVMLARDADQLTILEEMERLGGGLELIHTPNGTIRQVFIDRYKNGEVINTKDILTMGEWFICLKSWKNFFNFETTKQLYQESEFEKKIEKNYTNLYPENKAFWATI